MWISQNVCSSRPCASHNGCMLLCVQGLEKAVELDVDLVLLGGDLFHENKPTRTTIVKTIELLKRHRQHNKRVNFRILSNQAENFVSG